MKSLRFSALPICLLFSSCAVLTDSQVKNVNAFACTAKSYSSFPSAVVQSEATLHLHTELLTASQFENADMITHRLDVARKTYESSIQISTKFDLSLQMIQQYAALLTRLSSDTYINDLSSPTSDLGTNLNNVVALYNSKCKDSLPATIGTEVAEFVLFIGKELTRNKQTKAVRAFVIKADTMVQVAARNLVTVLDGDQFSDAGGNTYPTLKTLLAQEQARFSDSYKAVVFAHPEKINYESVKTYYDELTLYETTEQLRQGVVAANKSLAAAHAALAKIVQSKKDIRGLIDQTQQLANDMQSAAPLFNELAKRL